ncbi:pectate lyase [Fibrobacter sp. UWB1]|uniref:pectate lyase family protein n=1 Tax=unclassified Fibrobacter TaxID=2634177 RepID=UPI00091688B9|nr:MULTISPECIES: pectate lyase [unclassified Fibrobacter]OWV24881.1 pectate lyase [Fibrobacter sp. UWB1]SHL52734.1 pectate lyase [Fibrobacter sp. UWOV1]
MVKTQKNWSRTLAVGAALGAALATSAIAATSPDFPLTGWATQNGSTTGGANYGTVTVDNVSDLKSYAKAGNKTIYIKPGTYAGTVEVGSNVTLYGYPGVTITQPSKGSGIKISGSKNVILRNISVQGVGAVDEDDEDCLQINHEAKNIWIDHVHVYDGHDGNMDIVNQSDYITVSWSKFTYSSKSKNHQFSNLFGNSDSKTADANALKITVHHNWWGDGVKERMPRVRFGQVHVVNNLYTSSAASYCVRAGMKANIRVESNVFIGVKNPLDYNNQSKEDAKVSMINNYYEKTSGNTTGQGTAFTPPYQMSVTDVSTQAKAYALRDSIQAYAGPTLPAPGSSQVTPVSSSSIVVASSSSQAKSSSSVVLASSSSAKSSSSQTPVAGEASLTKHGSGSANQEVAQGASIVEFYYTIDGATGATVTGLPQGVTGTLKGLDYYISGTVASTAAAGAYKFTVTTTGATTNVSKSGTITVTGGGNIEPKSSSSETAAVSSSSEKLSSSSEVAEPSSSSETAQGIQAIVLTRVNLSVSGNELSIMGAMAKPITVFDMQGRLIYRNFSTSNQHAVTLPGAGGYLVRVGSESHTVRIR